MRASAEKPADLGEGTRGWDGLEGGDVEDGEACDAAGSDKGSADAEGFEEGDRGRHAFAFDSKSVGG